jgi:hypothetical protein
MMAKIATAQTMATTAKAVLTVIIFAALSCQAGGPAMIHPCAITRGPKKRGLECVRTGSQKKFDIEL